MGLHLCSRETGRQPSFIAALKKLHLFSQFFFFFQPNSKKSSSSLLQLQLTSVPIICAEVIHLNSQSSKKTTLTRVFIDILVDSGVTLL